MTEDEESDRDTSDAAALVALAGAGNLIEFRGGDVETKRRRLRLMLEWFRSLTDKEAGLIIDSRWPIAGEHEA